MIPVYTVKDVKKFWDKFNDLPKPWCGEGGRGGAPAHIYKSRDEAWLLYTKVRDHYLYSVGKVTLYELNNLWYPQMNAHAGIRNMHKN